MTAEIDWTDHEAIIRAELEPGEQLLWSGRPPQGFRIRLRDSFILVGGATFLFFGLFTAFNMDLIKQLWPPAFKAFWMGPVMLIAAYAVFVRPLLDVWIRRRIAYGVTSMRVVIVSNTLVRRIKSFEFDTMKLAQARKRPPGGVIRFNDEIALTEQEPFDRSFIPSSALTSLELASDADVVFGLIKKYKKPIQHK